MSSTPHFKPNDKALCIRSKPWLTEGLQVSERGVPVPGAIYTVEAIMRQSGYPALYLTGYTGWWDAAEFRRIELASERLAREAAQRADA